MLLQYRKLAVSHLRFNVGSLEFLTALYSNVKTLLLNLGEVT
jgi:hypothetical protein